MEKLLRKGMAALGLPVEDRVVALLLQHADLIKKWNRAYNLTAVCDTREMITKHVLDSLAIAPFIKGQRVLDVGTGAGFPGVPLAILFPGKDFTLLDSNGKKIRFLIQAVAALELKNVTAVQSRVESYLPDRPFDTIVTRAFAKADEQVALCKALLTEQAQLVVMKGRSPIDELADVTLPHEIHAVKVPGLEAERHVVIIKSAE